jgi:D-alanine transfer protein
VYLRREADLHAPAPDHPPHKHLRTGLAAMALFLALTVTGRLLLGFWADRYLYTLAPMTEDETVKGIGLTREATRHQDLLLLLGSSELTFQDELHPARLFAGEPTGFDVYLVGSGYRQSIHNFLTLSALGTDIRGKQAVLFLSPSWFTPTIADTAYRKNFSHVQAYEFVYTSPLSPLLRQRGARRLLALGSPGTDDPILRTALQGLASGSAWGRLEYGVIWPLGRLRLETLRLKDDIDVLRLVLTRHLQPEPAHTTPSEEPNWDRLMAQAGQEAQEKSASNEFGIHDGYYSKFVGPRLEQIKDSATSETWLDSTEYADLDLVLATLKELRVKPLFISLPVMGRYYDFKGHALADRQAYYARIRETVQKAGFPVIDFGDKEYEAGFLRDPWHPGWKGSVSIAKALDQFYHGQSPDSTR